MSYYDDRRHGKVHSGDRGYAADYYEEHPDNRRSSGARRDYGSQQANRPRHEFRRRASSIGGDPSYHLDRSSRNSSRQYEDSYFQRPRHGSSSESSRSSRHQNRRQSTGGDSRTSGYQDRYRSRDQGHDDSSCDKDGNDNDGGQGASSFLRDKGGELLMHAALPLLAAGAAEAFRARKEPGEWKGDKGKHVLTAAVTNGLVNKDPKKPSKHHVMDTTLQGLREGAPSREERAELQRRAGGSRTSSNLKKVAAAGAVAFAGKELYDRYGRSRSQARGQGYNDDRYRSKNRSQSVSNDRYCGEFRLDREENDYERRPRGRDRGDYWENYPSRGRDYRDGDYSSDGYSDSDMENNYDEDDDEREYGSRALARTRSFNDYPNKNPRRDCSCSECDSDLGDSSDEKDKAKKMKRDMLLTCGLATVATVHAAHKVYGSVNKRKKRMAQLEDGEITPEQARKERFKANTMDAASIGLAALGIKGAYGEWKEANEKRKEAQNFQHECLRRAAQRELKRNQRHY